jgi:hypothetical protein|tara:strand:+ start:430 stop:609 length:180 start_codon:yes stop_codon:yes gene_type:complete
MPRKFKTHKKTICRPVVSRVYPKYPIGSNEWHQEKERQMIVNKITERIAQENKKTINKK